MQINITITNAFTKQLEMATSTYTVAEGSIDTTHDLFSQAYPDSFVNFFWGEEGNKSFICGMPHNMKLDEIAHNEDRMTWEDYCNKWYKGALSGCNED